MWVEQMVKVQLLHLRTALIENDYSVGTFTSPFIESFNERISLNGVPIMNDEIVQLVEQS